MARTIVTKMKQNFSRIVAILFTLFLLTVLSSCRSDADRMAEFCLNYEAAVKTDDCTEMAANMRVLLAEPQPRLKDTSVCDKTTACLPCRVAINEMLKKCGQDEAVSEIMKTQMHFSTALREQMKGN